MSDGRRVVAFLAIAREELEAALLLARKLPRQAGYFAQQAVEKVARAVLAHEGIPFGTSHNIGQRAASLPAAHPWRPKLAAFDRLSPAATAYRYPAPGGRLAPLPSARDLELDLADIARALAEAEKTFAP
jgi:HEPN domain-containing protein